MDREFVPPLPRPEAYYRSAADAFLDRAKEALESISSLNEEGENTAYLQLAEKYSLISIAASLIDIRNEMPSR